MKKSPKYVSAAFSVRAHEPDRAWAARRAAQA